MLADVVMLEGSLQCEMLRSTLIQIQTPISVVPLVIL